jgi:hypothetical protein
LLVRATESPLGAAHLPNRGKPRPALRAS